MKALRNLIKREPALAKTLLQQEIRFRENLRLAREKSGLSIAEVAEKSNLSKRWLAEMEDPTVQPTLAELRRYMLAIGVYVTFHIHTDRSN